MKKLLQLPAMLTFMLLFSACTSTYITSSWKAPGVNAKKYEKIMVVGIIRDADRTIREKMETHLVNDLSARGFTAVSSFDKYGPKSFQGMTETQVNSFLAKEGVDAVLTVVLLDKQRERYYVPGRVVYTPYIMYHNRFYGYYNSLYLRIDDPGYYNITTNYFWESNFYDLQQNKLLYSVQTESFDPSSAGRLAHEYGLKIIENLIKSNVLLKEAPVVAKAL